MLENLITFFTNYGYAAVFSVLLLCGFGLPIPEDVTLVAGGVIAGIGAANVHLMFLVSMVGVLMGDSAMFFLGRLLGERAMKTTLAKKVLPEARYLKVQELFERYGRWVLFVGRFMPGLRAAIFLTAGISRKVTFLRFFLTDGLAALISVPIWVYLGYFGGMNLPVLETWVRDGQIALLALIIIAVAGFFIYKKYFSKRKKNDESVIPPTQGKPRL